MRENLTHNISRAALDEKISTGSSIFVDGGEKKERDALMDYPFDLKIILTPFIISWKFKAFGLLFFETLTDLYRYRTTNVITKIFELQMELCNKIIY